MKFVVNSGLLNPLIYCAPYCLYIHLTSPHRAGCETRSTFKGSKSGLNSELSFSKIGCLFTFKEHFQPNYIYNAGSW